AMSGVSRYGPTPWVSLPPMDGLGLPTAQPSASTPSPVPARSAAPVGAYGPAVAVTAFRSAAAAVATFEAEEAVERAAATVAAWGPMSAGRTVVASGPVWNVAGCCPVVAGYFLEISCILFITSST